ncbi:MAG: ATP-binding protein [Paludibacteraceae bacterium]|nr:ATP-binding protein [Paludibacteraceae bacterium]
MIINRDRYLQRLIAKKWNGKIKVITGLRRCGKSYLLNNLFVEHLLKEGIKQADIIMLALDEAANAKYRNPLELDGYIRQLTSNKRHKYYVLLDEIQKVESIKNPYLPAESDEMIGFVDVLLGIMKLPNVDVYVTGSNSKMLSKDVVTEFRDRGDEIHVCPLTFDEFYAAYQGEKRHAWRDFWYYGGMPYTMHLSTHEEKAKYLQELFQLTYIRDVIERNNIKADTGVLETLLDITASAVGSLTNPSRLANTFLTEQKLKIKSDTVDQYLEYFIDSYLLRKSQRYDVKGRSYISTPLKYYYSDVGLRNARLNFRQQEENHIMENVLYNELTARGFSVDVGVVPYHWKTEDGKTVHSQLEIDFVVNKSFQRYYIQSALNVDTKEKREQEIASLNRVDDSFRKIVVVKDDIIPWTDESGITYVGIEEFLLKHVGGL